MTRKSAPQLAWEKLKPWRRMLPNGEPKADVSRRQFMAIYQAAYRRGMERAAGVAEATKEPIGVWTEATSKTAAWHIGRNGAAARIRSFIAGGAKDE